MSTTQLTRKKSIMALGIGIPLLLLLALASFTATTYGEQGPSSDGIGANQQNTSITDESSAVLPLEFIDCDVPSTLFPTIQAAADQPACDIINIAAGTYFENIEAELNRDVTITGAGRDVTILDGSNTDSVMKIVMYGAGTTLTLTQMTIQNGFGTESSGVSDSGSIDAAGGGIYFVGNGDDDTIASELVVDDVKFTGNIASHGGAMFTSILLPAFSSQTFVNTGPRTLTIRNTEFSDNIATAEGGGLYASYFFEMDIQDTLFARNTAFTYGGGIHRLGNETDNITNSVFIDNEAGTSGGAIIGTQDGDFGGTGVGGGYFIENSCIVGNDDVAVDAIDQQPWLIDAEGNWWGDASGPSGLLSGMGDSIGSEWPVNINNWLSEPTPQMVNLGCPMDPTAISLSATSATTVSPFRISFMVVTITLTLAGFFINRKK